MNKPILIICLFLMPLGLYAQKVVEINNPSFEAQLQGGVSSFLSPDIDFWEDCSQIKFPSETPFDIQPGFWGVTLKPKHGSSYIGLVTRKNETYESIGQKIKRPLKRGSKYSLSIHIATSTNHKSVSSMIQNSNSSSIHNEKSLTVTNPAILRVRIENTITQESELVYTSTPITNNNWELLHIEFTPTFLANYIIFEAYFPNSNTPTFGNILIDAINMDNNDSNNPDIEHRIETLADYELLNLITEKKECSEKSEILKPIVSVNNLIQNKEELISYFDGLSREDKAIISSDLEIVNAISHSRAISQVNKDTFTSNYIKAESERSLYRILINYMSLNRKIIKNEILLCH